MIIDNDALLSRPQRWIIRWPPTVVLLLLYMAVVFLGAALLTFPFASHTGTSHFDALFTAVSAVTVTGLVVVDTGSHYTFWGQLVIAALIQLGGLGLMTFAVFVLSLLGMKMPVGQQIILREDLNQTDIGNLMRLVWLILRIVIVFEIAGAALLAVRFVPEFGWIMGMWQAVFHSVSAFNNAGFGLFSDSLMRYVGDPLINIIITGLFITGGLGYSVLADLRDKGSWTKLTLHSKLMLSGTIFLTLIAIAGVAALEWSNPATLAGLGGWPDKFWAVWFQAVTTRTAGFNTIDTASLHDSTSLLVMVLMFIGGGSTSTAGGIKVTTFIVFLLATRAFFRRRNYIVAFGRSISAEQVFKVFALVAISLMTVTLGLFAVMVTNKLAFIDLAFEVFSAFGTVGLSRGITAELDHFGRAVIILIMFIGRVGPLALGFFLASRTAPRIRYPSSDVLFG